MIPMIIYFQPGQIDKPDGTGQAKLGGKISWYIPRWKCSMLYWKSDHLIKMKHHATHPPLWIFFTSNYNNLIFHECQFVRIIGFAIVNSTDTLRPHYRNWTRRPGRKFISIFHSTYVNIIILGSIFNSTHFLWVFFTNPCIQYDKYKQYLGNGGGGSLCTMLFSPTLGIGWMDIPLLGAFSIQVQCTGYGYNKCKNKFH